MAQNKSNKTLNIYGNLGADPKEHTIPAKRGTYRYYDATIDEVVEKEFDHPEHHFLTYSIATGGYNDIPTRWIYCVDWEGIGFRLRKGDRVQLNGYFEDRTYEKNGETKTVRQFVVNGYEIKKLKTREFA
jgi:single-stranded DNA-binding protein